MSGAQHYVLQNPTIDDYSGWAYASDEDGRSAEEFALGEGDPDAVLLYGPRGGRRFGDVLWTSWPAFPLVTPRVLAALAEAGCDTRAVARYRVLLQPRPSYVPDYVAVGVRRIDASLDWSTAVSDVTPGPWPAPILRGPALVLGRDEPPDLFRAANSLALLVSARARDALVDCAAVNVECVPLDEVSTPDLGRLAAPDA